MPSKNAPVKPCFLSHAHEHKAEALFLKEQLEDLFPETGNVFIDSVSILPGSAWYEEIMATLRQSRALVALLNPQTAERPWLLFEYGAAVGLRIKAIALCFDGLTADALPAPISHFQPIELSREQDVERWLDLMAIALPPREERLRTVARRISGRFKDLRPANANFNHEIQLRSVEYRLQLAYQLSDTQRALLNHILTWQGDQGVLESDIRKGHPIPYARNQVSGLQNVLISPSEYYFRLRDLYHQGLVTMTKVNATENRWAVRPEIAVAIRPTKVA